MNQHVRSLRVAGIFGTLVGPFVLTFAVLGSIQGHAFAVDLLQGGDSSSWVEAVRSHPAGWRLTMSCVAAGFLCMLGCARSFFQGRHENDWRRALSLLCYTIGVPAVTAIFALQSGLMWWLTMHTEPLSADLQALVDLTQLQYMIYAFFFGPALVVAGGSGMMAWVAWSSRIVPRWVSGLGMLCGVFSITQMFQTFVPVLRYTTDFAGPIHMLWFTIFGISLLRVREGDPTTVP